ncbi:Vacuolar ATP synthase G3 isoform 1 [Tripterygium wilfordii]|uniref:Vacuolar ATP synthase G3 isoform 1 n=1 Tax=Tripterygium wilfordii TaxID=458696 RepID=A0A7J7CBU7_TRIWF|nr:Vacuolar ATP synthase G3 isoform 1 [Tripterygium wilfordii]
MPKLFACSHNLCISSASPAHTQHSCSTTWKGVKQQKQRNMIPAASKSGGFSLNSLINLPRMFARRELEGIRRMEIFLSVGSVMIVKDLDWLVVQAVEKEGLHQSKEGKDKNIFILAFSSTTLSFLRSGLASEQEAQRVVTDARNLKMARLKQAKDEAERDLALYRSNSEHEFQKKISEASGSSGSTVKRLEEDTDVKIKNLKDSTSWVSAEAVNTLIKYVVTVKY